MLGVVYKSTGGRLWNKPWVRRVLQALVNSADRSSGQCMSYTLAVSVTHSRPCCQGLPPLTETQKANRAKNRKAEQQVEQILKEAASKEVKSALPALGKASKKPQ